MNPFSLIVSSLFLASVSRADVAFPFPQNSNYDGNGIRAQTITPERLDELFLRWRQLFFVEEADVAYAATSATSGTVYSDQIANAMLFCVYFSSKSTSYQPQFDKLLAYHARWRDAYGLMNWNICNASIMGSGSISTADVQTAAALILAAKQFRRPAYLDTARRMLDAIRTHDVDSNHLLKGGDSYEPAYHTASQLMAPFFRLFSNVDTAHGAFWDSVRIRHDTLMLANRNPDNGVLSDDMAPDGASLRSQEMGYDGVGVPFLQLMDYYWNRGDAAATYLDRFAITILRTNAWSEPAVTSFSWTTGLPRTGRTNATEYSFTGAMAATFGSGFSQSPLNTLSTRLVEGAPADFFGSSNQLLYALLLSGNMPDLSRMTDAPVAIEPKVSRPSARRSQGPNPTFRADGRMERRNGPDRPLVPGYEPR